VMQNFYAAVLVEGRSITELLEFVEFLRSHPHHRENGS